MSHFHVRPAHPEDWEFLVDFNIRLAGETENKQLDRETVIAGVQALLDDSGKGRYFVACRDQKVVGQAMHTWEWSDWRNGEIWWLQSVYVHPEYRRQGVFRLLYDYMFEAARSDPNVVGIRLYVENDNQRAQDTYEGLGMQAAGYSVMEKLFT